MLPRPNVLWILTDEHRTDAISAYGGQPAVSTPALDGLASFVDAEIGRLLAAVDGCGLRDNWKLVVYNWGLPEEERQLFNLENDPAETEDLTGDLSARGIECALWDSIEDWYRRTPWHPTLASMRDASVPMSRFDSMCSETGASWKPS